MTESPVQCSHRLIDVEEAQLGHLIGASCGCGARWSSCTTFSLPMAARVRVIAARTRLLMTVAAASAMRVGTASVSDYDTLIAATAALEHAFADSLEEPSPSALGGRPLRDRAARRAVARARARKEQALRRTYSQKHAEPSAASR